MALPKVISAYNDCVEYFEKAIAAPSGIRIQFADEGDAAYFRMRMTQARSLVREDTKRMYPADHPAWNRSEFDVVQVRAPVEDTEGHWWVYVERHNARVLAVEILDSTNQREVEPPVILLLPAPDDANTKT